MKITQKITDSKLTVFHQKQSDSKLIELELKMHKQMEFTTRIYEEMKKKIHNLEEENINLK